MGNIQKTLESLQPYVISIRYLEGIPLIDAVFKEGWTIPDDPKIKKVEGDKSMNYFMLYSEQDGIGLDELLAYVDRVIKANQEREKKHELLRKKVTELKELFQKTSLTKLQRLKFTLGEEDLVPTLSEMSVDEMIDEPIEEQVIETPIEEDIIEQPAVAQPTQPAQFLDENKQPIPLTDEEKEMIEEERRAEINRQKFAKKPVNGVAAKIELPPKRSLQTAVQTVYADCDCGPNEACSKCMDSKDL
jgi:hypothetical protein